jgi:hypothetical protein
LKVRIPPTGFSTDSPSSGARINGRIGGSYAVSSDIPELTVIVSLVVASGARKRIGLAAADSIAERRLGLTFQRCVAAAFPRPSSVT